MSDMRREDLENGGSGLRADTPTNWELLRQINSLKETVRDNQGAVLAKLDAAYGRGEIDARLDAVHGRLTVLETSHLAIAANATAQRHVLIGAAVASALTFAGNLALLFIR